MQVRSFKDSQGRVWTLAVVYDTIVEVLSKTGIDLRHLVDDHEATAAHLDNPATLREVVGIMLDDQLEKASLTVKDLFRSITTEAQSDAIVLGVYQATFDFFQNEGGVLNDALGRVDRARKAAQAHRTHSLRTELNNGLMDQYLGIVFSPEAMAEWAQACVTDPNISQVWKELEHLPVETRATALVKTCLTRGLTPKPTSTPSTNAGDSPVSSESTPAGTPGVNSP